VYCRCCFSREAGSGGPRSLDKEGKRCSPVPQGARYCRCRDARDERVRRDANQCRVGTNSFPNPLNGAGAPFQALLGPPGANQNTPTGPRPIQLLERSSVSNISRISKQQKKPFRNRCFPENLACPPGVDAFPSHSALAHVRIRHLRVRSRERNSSFNFRMPELIRRFEVQSGPQRYKASLSYS